MEARYRGVGARELIKGSSPETLLTRCTTDAHVFEFASTMDGVQALLSRASALREPYLSFAMANSFCIELMALAYQNRTKAQRRGYTTEFRYKNESH
jgi:hypothetical protein